MMIFDTHAHYDDEAFDEDRKIVLASLPKQGIEAVVNAGADIKSVKTTLKLTEEYHYIYGTAGVHPSSTGELDEENFAWLKMAAREPKVVAIGEIGLDYYWEEPDHDTQKKWFSRQLELAKEAHLPVVIHSRDAARDTLHMMKDHKAEEVGGVIHCFSYGTDMAREYLNMGYYLGIGGVLTFKNSKKLKEVVAYAPIEQLVLETDCPYMAPDPYRGKRNSSLNLTYVAKTMADIKGMEPEQIIEITNRNAKRLYHLQA